MRIIVLLLLLFSGCVNYSPDITGEQYDKTVLFVYGLGQSPKDKNVPFRKYTENRKLKCIYTSFQNDVSKQISENSPSLIIGYSAGGQTALNGIYANHYVEVRHLILLDPVPNGFIKGFHVTNNVKQADCIIRRTIFPPYSKPIISGENYSNSWVDWSHESFPVMSDKIIKDALDELENLR